MANMRIMAAVVNRRLRREWGNFGAFGVGAGSSETGKGPVDVEV